MVSKIRVLVACECSGVVRRAFNQHPDVDCWSSDVKPAEDKDPRHLKGDVRQWLDDTAWDLIIAHPECRYLCSSGIFRNKIEPGRAKKTEEAFEFFMLFARLKCRYCIENPVGIVSTRWRKPDQVIQPYYFGEPDSKKTCLWLQGVPLLRGTKFHLPDRWIDGKPRWRNQTDSGQNKLPPGVERSAKRARTYPGIAEAMANQWLPVIRKEKGMM